MNVYQLLTSVTVRSATSCPDPCDFNGMRSECYLPVVGKKQLTGMIMFVEGAAACIIPASAQDTSDLPHLVQFESNCNFTLYTCVYIYIMLLCLY